MIFYYKLIDHDINKMQEFLDFIFYEVWMKANSHSNFTINLFNANQDFKDIIFDFDNATVTGNQTNWKKLFVTKIKNIFTYCQNLNDDEIKKIKYWYASNNNIRKSCKKQLRPVKYAQLRTFNRPLAIEINDFYTMLYDHILDKGIIKNKFSSLLNYNKEFLKVNNIGICPFCGLSEIYEEYSKNKSAYDHYLPKAIYPFNSVNFKNLAPICDKCNGRANKGIKDPLFNLQGIRRKSFYSYSKSDNLDFSILLTINSNDMKIKPEDVTINIQSTKYHEEIQTWDDIFSINERYKEVCSSNSQGKEWIMKIEDDLNNYNTSFKFLNKLMYKFNKYIYLKTLKKSYERNPYAEKRFLKIPFLEACKKAGIIS
jgi:hypothetical protein